MEYLQQLFENQHSLSSLSQIVLDLLILGLLAVVLLGKKRRLLKKDSEVIDSFQKIVEETGSISRDFEANLQQRQNLIHQITAGLDQRILEAQKMCDRLEQLIRQLVQANADVEAKSIAAGNARARNSEHQKVVALAQKGLNASDIARNLKKPLGEVELILNLQKISS
jgi:hypothetical protein